MTSGNTGYTFKGIVGVVISCNRLLKFADSTTRETPTNLNEITSGSDKTINSPSLLMAKDSICQLKIQNADSGSCLHRRTPNAAIPEFSEDFKSSNSIISAESSICYASELFDRLENSRILDNARYRIAMFFRKDRNKLIISHFGRQAFDALFDSTEIVEGCYREMLFNESTDFHNRNSYDPEKCTFIASFCSWLITKPGELTMESFRKFVTRFAGNHETCLNTEDYRSFKEIVIVKYANERKREIFGEKLKKGLKQGERSNLKKTETKF